MIEINKTQGAPADAPSMLALFDETLDGAEARDVVLALLDATINTHKLWNLRAQVNSESPDVEATAAIDQLTAARHDLGSFLARMNAQGVRVKLRSTLEIELEDEGFSR